MHPQTCYAGQISLCHAKIEKISKKNFIMTTKMGGQFLDFMGGHSYYEGGHRAQGGSSQSPPPGKAWNMILQIDVYIQVTLLRLNSGCSVT